MKTLLSLIALCWIVPLLPGAAEASWKIGLAAVKITPTEPALMYGYAGRNEPHKGVASDLFAKALAFEDPTVGRAQFSEHAPRDDFRRHREDSPGSWH